MRRAKQGNAAVKHNGPVKGGKAVRMRCVEAA